MLSLLLLCFCLMVGSSELLPGRSKEDKVESPSENLHHESLKTSTNAQEIVEPEPSGSYVFPVGSEEIFKTKEKANNTKKVKEVNKLSMKMLRLGRGVSDEDIVIN
nr:myomodulin neuropeptides-like [Biomphalaria glabrata]